MGGAVLIRWRKTCSLEDNGTIALVIPPGDELIEQMLSSPV
jgi:hypothetical protein